MIEKLWTKMMSESAYGDYGFKNVDPPTPDADSISKCRTSCKENLCGCYDRNWGCPPGSGIESDCLAKLTRFSKAALLSLKFDIDPKNEIALKEITVEHQDVCRKLGNAMKKHGYDVFPLADGGCRYCGECSYPSAPCRFPDQQIPSISGFGIDMGAYLKSQGVEFTFKKDSVTLYSIMLYNEPSASGCNK